MADARTMTLDAVDRRVVNELQGGFPLCARPYAVAAERLGLREDELIARLRSLLDRKVLTRFGPLFQIERVGGAFVLAALRVPEADFERTATILETLPEVAHNYRREHEFNMWFVLATETPDSIDDTVARIERLTGLHVFCFPKEREYFVEMKLEA